MRKNRFIIQILATVFMVSCLGTAMAAESVMTVFPRAAVKVTENNGRVMRMTTNFPLKPGVVMEAEGGPCTVQGANCSFTAQDKARFSFKNVGGKWICTIYSGKVNYVLRPDSKVEFAHAKAMYDCQKIIPAEAGGNVEGTAAVSGDKLVFAGSTGKLVVVDPAVDDPVIVPGAAGLAPAIAAGAADGAFIGLSSENSSYSAQ